MSRLKDPKLIFWIVVVLALMIGSRLLLPVPLPHIQLPAEVVPGIPAIPLPGVGKLEISNTIIAILATDLLLIALALAATRRLEMVPSGLQNVFEAVIEYWENMSLQMIGPDLTRRYLPLFVTLFLMVALANWSELVPGYDTIGVLFQPGHSAAQAEGATGTGIAGEVASGEEGQEHTLFEVNWLGDPGRSFGMAMRRLEVEGAGAAEASPASAEQTAPPGQAGQAGQDDEHSATADGWAFVPFLRVASSDLNFTLALALIAVIATEIVGLQSLGLGYLRKFFAFDFSQGVGTGVLNIFVGLLELVSELARIVSFSFRLFGNLFAGQTLLFVIPFLIPLVAVLPIFGLELFVGMIQGFVFGILTLAFMSVATISHQGDHH